MTEATDVISMMSARGMGWLSGPFAVLQMTCHICCGVTRAADLQAAATAAAARSLAAAALVAASVVVVLAVAAPAAVVDLESRHANKHRLQTPSLNSETNMLLVAPTLARTAQASWCPAAQLRKLCTRSISALQGSAV